MRNRRLALVGLVLTLGLMPRVGQSQGTASTEQKPQGGSLGKSYPNPFNPEQRTDFSVGSYPDCSADKAQHKVSLVILNVLAQRVAVPQLFGSSGGVAGGQYLEGALLPCGHYTAYWNGKYQGTSREAASGVYVWVLDVDGKRMGAQRVTAAK